MWYPHVTVATVVEHQDRFLLVRERVDGKEYINQPAGHLEEDETLIEAAVRETREETGWVVQPEAVLGLSLYQSPHNRVTYLRTTFIATAVTQLPDAELDTGIIEALWLSEAEVRAQQSRLRSPMVLQDIERYRAGQAYPLELIGQHR